MNLAEKWLYSIVGGGGAALLAAYVRIFQAGLHSPGDNPMGYVPLIGALLAVAPSFGLVWLLFGQPLEKHKLWLLTAPLLMFLLVPPLFLLK
jgi:hypothetical protein